MKLDNPNKVGAASRFMLTKMSVLKVSDAFCYICRGVLIEPVTVPCLHVFCYKCFEQSMQETSYSCPLCRKRISNWVRAAKKANKLINKELWDKIKEQFEEQVNLKLRGEDDGLDEKIKQECSVPFCISNPGEVAKEFSKFVKDFQAEQDRLQAAEELASNELIVKLRDEESKELEIVRRESEINSKKDEELARKLQEEINKDVPTNDNRRKTLKNIGPLDSFFNGTGKRQRSLCQDATRSTSCDSTDSIQSEMHHFKPIKVVPRTPPKRYPDGKVLEIELTKVKPVKLLNSDGGSVYNGAKNLVGSKKIHSPYSAFIGKIVTNAEESPRKRMRLCQDESDVLKEITLGENSDSNSMNAMDVSCKPSHIWKKNVQSNLVLPPKLIHFDSAEEENENSDLPQFDTQDYINPELGIEEDLIEEQRRIEKLILQEKADRELALKLSKEWEGRYELRNKPTNQKPVAVKRKAKLQKSKNLQQTLIDTLVRTRTRK